MITRQLGEVADFYGGSSLPRGEEFTNQSGGYFLLRVSDLNIPQNSIYVTTSSQWSPWPGSKAATAPKNSLVIPKRGGAIGTNKKRIITRDCILDPNLMAIHPHEEDLDIRFLYHWFRTFDLLDIVSGSTVPQLNKQDLFPLRLPIPSIEDQRRIAEVLNRADELRTKRQQSIMLLEDLTRSLFLDMFGHPVTNPKDWKSLSLSEACRMYSGGTPSKAIPENWEGDLPWFSAKDLKKSDLWDSQDHIDEDITRRTSLKLLEKDTVVIVVRGMILRHTFPVSVLRVPAAINQDLKALLPRVHLTSQFLANCLRVQAPYVLQQVSTAAHGTTRLDSDDLGKIPVIVPPLALQQEFSNHVAAIEETVRASTEGLRTLDELFASLQARAFRVEL